LEKDEKAGFKPSSHHKYRVFRFVVIIPYGHSVATLLHSSGGCDLKDIQTWLGHSDISTTANIYSHIFYSEKVAMGEKLDAALFNSISTNS
jgi:integrase